MPNERLRLRRQCAEYSYEFGRGRFGSASAAPVSRFAGTLHRSSGSRRILAGYVSRTSSIRLPSALRGLSARRIRADQQPAGGPRRVRRSAQCPWLWGLHRRRAGQFAALPPPDAGLPALAEPSVFPDILDPMLDAAHTFIDPGRFTADYEASLAYPALPFLTLRIAVMASGSSRPTYCLSLGAAGACGVLPARLRLGGDDASRATITASPSRWCSMSRDLIADYRRLLRALSVLPVDRGRARAVRRTHFGRTAGPP